MELESTGEYCVPTKTPPRIVADHVARYTFATQFVAGKRVLDIACGTGYGSSLLANAGAKHVAGVDVTEEVIAYAREHYAGPTLTFHQGDITTYTAPTPYDVIVCFETIEHIADENQALRNLSSLLATDGVLLISSPNRLVTSPSAHSITDRPANRFHVREYTPTELKERLVRHGFVVDDAAPYGQRFRPALKSSYLTTLYSKLFNPNERSSPRVGQKQWLTPRYFLLMARKAT